MTQRLSPSAEARRTAFATYNAELAKAMALPVGSSAVAARAADKLHAALAAADQLDDRPGGVEVSHSHSHTLPCHPRCPRWGSA